MFMTTRSKKHFKQRQEEMAEELVKVLTKEREQREEIALEREQPEMEMKQQRKMLMERRERREKLISSRNSCRSKWMPWCKSRQRVLLLLKKQSSKM